MSKTKSMFYGLFFISIFISPNLLATQNWGGVDHEKSQIVERRLRKLSINVSKVKIEGIGSELSQKRMYVYFFASNNSKIHLSELIHIFLSGDYINKNYNYGNARKLNSRQRHALKMLRVSEKIQEIIIFPKDLSAKSIATFIVNIKDVEQFILTRNKKMFIEKWHIRLYDDNYLLNIKKIKLST